jgi:hypothetical protein
MDPILIREWDNDKFHQRVLELESNGYVARRETYTVQVASLPKSPLTAMAARVALQLCCHRK